MVFQTVLLGSGTFFESRYVIKAIDLVGFEPMEKRVNGFINKKQSLDQRSEKPELSVLSFPIF